MSSRCYSPLVADPYCGSKDNGSCSPAKIPRYKLLLGNPPTNVLRTHTYAFFDGFRIVDHLRFVAQQYQRRQIADLVFLRQVETGLFGGIDPMARKSLLHEEWFQCLALYAGIAEEEQLLRFTGAFGRTFAIGFGFIGTTTIIISARWRRMIDIICQTLLKFLLLSLIPECYRTIISGNTAINFHFGPALRAEFLLSGKTSMRFTNRECWRN